MEKFSIDPLQEKFNKKLGIELSETNSNRILSAQEWFDKYYTNQTIEELPKILHENHSLEELQALIDTHKQEEPRKAQASDQTTIDFPENSPE